MKLVDIGNHNTLSRLCKVLGVFRLTMCSGVWIMFTVWSFTRVCRQVGNRPTGLNVGVG